MGAFSEFDAWVWALSSCRTAGLECDMWGYWRVWSDRSADRVLGETKKQRGLGEPVALPSPSDFIQCRQTCRMYRLMGRAGAGSGSRAAAARARPRRWIDRMSLCPAVDRSPYGYPSFVRDHGFKQVASATTVSAHSISRSSLCATESSGIARTTPHRVVAHHSGRSPRRRAGAARPWGLASHRRGGRGACHPCRAADIKGLRSPPQLRFRLQIVDCRLR